MSASDLAPERDESASQPRREDRALTRRGFVALNAAAATTLAGLDAAVASDRTVRPNPDNSCTTVPDTPTAERPDPQKNWRVFSAPETELAFRNHGMQAEF